MVGRPIRRIRLFGHSFGEAPTELAYPILRPGESWSSQPTTLHWPDGLPARCKVALRYDCLRVGWLLYYKRKVYYPYHRNISSKAFYTLYYSHVTH
jgi:hypothetical protein